MDVKLSGGLPFQQHMTPALHSFDIVTTHVHAELVQPQISCSPAPLPEKSYVNDNRADKCQLVRPRTTLRLQSFVIFRAKPISDVCECKVHTDM